jgi:magnesium transporter
VLERTDVAVDELASVAADPRHTLWIDCRRDDTDTIRQLAQIFGLHPVAVEDALTGHVRPKLHRYDTHIYALVYGTSASGADGTSATGGNSGAGLPEGAGLAAVTVPAITSYEMSIFATPRALISIHEATAPDIADAVAAWEAHPELLKEGSAALLWSLLDQLVDSHLESIQQLEECASDIEDVVFDENASFHGAQQKLYALHKETAHLRRISLPIRDVVGGILRFGVTTTESSAITPYFQDVYDHCMRVADWSDSLHDSISTLFDSTLSAQSNRMNLIMKKVTSWAAIIAVPTLITGYFGMNVGFPLYGTAGGAWFSAALIVVTGAVLYGLFRRNDWL